MLRKLIPFLLLSFATITASAAIPSQLDTQKWQELVEQVQLNGLFIPTQNGVYLSVSHVVPNEPYPTYSADYLSTVGYYDTNDNYIVNHLEGVSEIVTIDKDGNWNYDQWIYVAELDANLIKSLHRLIVKRPDNVILKIDTLPTTEAEKLASWNDRLTEWFKRMPLPL